jgi:hypothetical protein
MNSLFIILLILLFPSCYSSQLKNDLVNRCVARGNGTVFNISSLPWESFVFYDTRNPPYKYTLSSPCSETSQWINPCPTFPSNTSILCQYDHLTQGEYYDCGNVNSPPIWFMNYWQPLQFSILFSGGTYWRITNLTFVVDNTIDPPVATFVSESPYLQYNVIIRGKCVGQPWGCNSDGKPTDDFVIDPSIDMNEPIDGWNAMHINKTGGACCTPDCSDCLNE